MNVIRRNFATEAKHAVPKRIHGSFGRYAGATYVAASKVRIFIYTNCNFICFVGCNFLYFVIHLLHFVGRNLAQG